MTNAELGRRWARAWSRHDPEALSDLFDPDGEYDDVAFAVVSRGPGGARGWAEGFLAAFPDLMVDVVAEFATDGDEVVEWLMFGTHLGQFDGLSPERPALPGPRSVRSAHPRGPYRSLLGLLGPRDGAPPAGRDVTPGHCDGDPNLPGHEECMILDPGTGHPEFWILRSEAERGTAS